jgi:hypothetical protein
MNSPPPSPAQTVLRTAWGLGLLGLIPFVGLAVAGYLKPLLRADILTLQLQYAALIVSFLGAIHWGAVLATLRRQEVPALAPLRLIWGVSPSLLAWVCLQLAPAWSLIGLAGCLILAWVADLVAAPGYPLPIWYRRLRTVLTCIATASLLASTPLHV